MQSILTKKRYYIIETPPITDTTNGSNSVYNYNKTENGEPRVNDISKMIYKQTKNTIYYDEIVYYNPNGNIFKTTSSLPCNFKGGFNIYDISKHISNKLIKFIEDLQLINTCNSYASPSNEPIPNNCSNTFIDYDTNSKIATQKNNITGNKLPLYIFLESIDSDSNRKKHLQQQLNDIDNLIKSFNTLLNFIQTDNSNNNIPAEQYEELVQKNSENIQLRNELDSKLSEIYEYNNSNIVNSKINMDSSVYAGVLWSILATSLVYFVFVKL